MGEKNLQKYQIISQIGEGSYGKVFKGIRKKDQEIVAIKSIDLGTDWLPLLSEINMVSDLRHESIVQYYEWFFEDGKLFIVMEYCDGGSLSNIIDTLGTGMSEKKISAGC